MATATPITFTDGVVVVQMTTLDALTTGQMLRTLARDKRTPPGQRPFLDRVGTQLFAAAQLALKDGR